MNPKELKKLMPGHQERYHYPPQEVFAQHLSLKSQKGQFPIPHSDAVVFVWQLQKCWLDLKAQRKTVVVTITALHQACRATFKLERFRGAASFGDNKQSSEKKNLLQNIWQSHPSQSFKKQTVWTGIKDECFYSLLQVSNLRKETNWSSRIYGLKPILDLLVELFSTSLFFLHVVELSNHSFDSLAVLRNISQAIKVRSDSWSFYSSVFFYCQGLVSIIMKRAKDCALFNVFRYCFIRRERKSERLNIEHRSVFVTNTTFCTFYFSRSQSVSQSVNDTEHCKIWLKISHKHFES